jgi:hypothetical protein
MNEAFWAAIVLAGLTALFTTLSLTGIANFGLGASSFLDSAIFAGVALGIRRRSRAAAITGLVIYGLGRMYVWFVLGHFSVAVYQYILILAFVNGVRGSLVYHKLPPKPANQPALEESFRMLASVANEPDQHNKN